VTVLPGAGKSFEQFQTDDVVCRQWASQQTGTTRARASGSSAAEGAGGGTLLGAGLGGLLAGTAVGAGAGRRAGDQVQHRYDNAYEQRMYAKGNQVPARLGGN
jgi:hypothetical protein